MEWCLVLIVLCVCSIFTMLYFIHFGAAGRIQIVHSVKTRALTWYSCPHYCDGSHHNVWMANVARMLISSKCYSRMKINMCTGRNTSLLVLVVRKLYNKAKFRNSAFNGCEKHLYLNIKNHKHFYSTTKFFLSLHLDNLYFNYWFVDKQEHCKINIVYYLCGTNEYPYDWTFLIKILSSIWCWYN